MKVIKLFLAVLLAAASSSCVTHVHANNSGKGEQYVNVNGVQNNSKNGGGVGAVRPGRPAPHLVAQSHLSHGRSFTAPSGLRPLKGCPPWCKVITSGGHQVICEKRSGKRVGFLPPAGYRPRNPHQVGGEWVYAGGRGHGGGGYNDGYYNDGRGYLQPRGRYSNERPQQPYQPPRNHPNMRDQWDTGPGNPRPLSVVTPNGSERIF